jgi:hypothetical protein
VSNSCPRVLRATRAGPQARQGEKAQNEPNRSLYPIVNGHDSPRSDGADKRRAATVTLARAATSPTVYELTTCIVPCMHGMTWLHVQPIGYRNTVSVHVRNERAPRTFGTFFQDFEFKLRPYRHVSRRTKTVLPIKRAPLSHFLHSPRYYTRRTACCCVLQLAAFTSSHIEGRCLPEAGRGKQLPGTS